MKISKIKLGNRVRKDMGDVAALAASIERQGLLHQIVVTKDGILVAGARRIEAYRVLGRADIPATVIDVPSLLAAERDENEVRKNFTPSEAVAIALLVEEEERPKARERKREAGRRHHKGSPKGSVKFTEPLGQQNETARDPHNETTAIAGRAVGMSRPTYTRAKAVVVAAEEDPGRFGDLVKQMDETGKVWGPWKELKRRKGTVVEEQIANGERHPSSRRLKKMAPPSNGLQFARMAILDLEQITPEDTERDAAFDLVRRWIDDSEEDDGQKRQRAGKARAPVDKRPQHVRVVRD